jgi:enamine deaminase RidA (YjgF/YER057c/UK114 family)
MKQDSAASAGITKAFSDSMDVITVSKPDVITYDISSKPTSESDFLTMLDSFAELINEKGATILSQFVFGGHRYYEDTVKKMEKLIGPIDWPITWVQGDGCTGEHMTGTQVYAIAGVDVDRIEVNGKIIGSQYEDDDGRYCIMGDMTPDDTNQTRKEQTDAAFAKIEAGLEAAGMDFSNVVRTWMYLDDLLSWYDDFNEVRNNFFIKRGVFDALVPTSTGIGASNMAGAALVTGAYAVDINEDISIKAIPSPLQCPALDYKSSFSRAIEIKFPSYRKIIISGTASIAPEGHTVHVGDYIKQIALTMKVTRAILESRGMDWDDASRGIAYFRDITKAPLLTEYCRENELPPIPFAYSHAHVCRDDLLFEIELDAVKSR